MYKIFGLIPVSIAGSLIIKGLIKGLEQNGCIIKECHINDFNKNTMAEFKPDFIIGYDYAHFMDSDVEQIISKSNIPVVHYFADDPMSKFSHGGNHSLFNKLSDSNGIVCCWDKHYLNVFNNTSFYLPIGIDTDAYNCDSLLNGHDLSDKIVFVGRPLTEKRINLLCDIIKRFPEDLFIYCYKRHFDSSLDYIKQNNLLDYKYLNYYENCYRGFLNNEVELANVYSKAAIILNITMQQGVSSINYRVFEAFACDGFLISDYTKDIAEYFNDGEDLVFYSDKNDLFNKVLFYLKNESLRKNISRNAKSKLLKHHTVKERAKYLIQQLKKYIEYDL